MATARRVTIVTRSAYCYQCAPRCRAGTTCSAGGGQPRALRQSIRPRTGRASPQGRVTFGMRDRRVIDVRSRGLTLARARAEKVLVRSVTV